MSCVCILTPVVIAAWPAFSAAAVAAATSLGYALVDTKADASVDETMGEQRIHLEIAQSELVTDTLGRGQKLTVARGTVTMTFSRDPRGRASLCVSGEGHTDDELRALGEELAQRVVQQYVYQKLMAEMKTRGFHVVEEEINEDNSIRLKIRHWDG